MAQLHDKGVGIIKQKLSQGERKYKCFRQDHNGVLWFESRLVVPKIMIFGSKFSTRHIFPNFLFTRTVPRCTKILSKIFGGLG